MDNQNQKPQKSFLSLPPEIRQLIYANMTLPDLIEVGKLGTRFTARFTPYYVDELPTDIECARCAAGEPCHGPRHSQYSSTNPSFDGREPLTENNVWTRILRGLDPRAHWMEMYPHPDRWRWWKYDGGVDSDWMSNPEEEEEEEQQQQRDGEEWPGVPSFEKDARRGGYDEVRFRQVQLEKDWKGVCRALMRTCRAVCADFMEIVIERVRHSFMIAFEGREVQIMEEYTGLRKADVIVLIREDQTIEFGLETVCVFVRSLRTQIRSMENLEELRIILKMEHTKRYLGFLNDFRDWATQYIAATHLGLPKLKSFLFVQQGSPTNRRDGFILDRKGLDWALREKLYEMPRDGVAMKRDVTMTDVESSLE